MTIYSDLKAEENYRIKLVLSDFSDGKREVSRVVTAVLQNDISIAGGNDFTTARDIIAETPIAGTIAGFKDKFAAQTKVFGKSVTTQLETGLAWSNSLKPNISVEMTFYQEDATQGDILSDYMKIKAAVLPSGVGAFFKAPLGYRLVEDLARITKKASEGKTTPIIKPKGLVTLQIGKWLRMTGMVMISESFTFSKEVNSNGQPLFITGSVTLEPFQALTYAQFQKYFIKTPKVGTSV